MQKEYPGEYDVVSVAGLQDAGVAGRHGAIIFDHHLVEIMASLGRAAELQLEAAKRSIVALREDRQRWIDAADFERAKAEGAYAHPFRDMFRRAWKFLTKERG